MEDEKNLNSAPVEEVEIQQQEPIEQELAAPEEQERSIDDKERNLARLREARERADYERQRAEKERDEAIAYIRQIQMQQQQQPEPEDDINWDSDEYVEAKQVNNKIKRLENKLRSYEEQTNYQVTEARLRAQYNDFDNIVNKASVEALRNQYPEIAESLHRNPDIYNKAVSTYNIIKKFGLATPAESTKQLADKALVARNATKPRATNSISPQSGDSPLNKANDFANGFLTDERKAQLWAEIKAARSQ